MPLPTERPHLSPRVVIIEPEAAGGLAHFSFQLSGGLAECGAKVSLVTGKGFELAAAPRDFELLEEMNLWGKFEAIPKTTMGRRIRSFVRSVRRLQRGARYYLEWYRITRLTISLEPDIVLFPLIRFPPVYFFARILQRRGIRLAHICHEFQDRETGGTPLYNELLRSKIYQSFDIIFFLAESEKGSFEESYGCREATRLLPHGPQLLFSSTDASDADVEQHFGIETGDRLVLFFGGLRPSKGLTDLVAAWPLVDTHPEPVLLIAGHPDKNFDLPQLEKQIAESSAGHRIILRHEYVPNDLVGALLLRAEVVVFPYRNASASGALSAAQTFGRPVVVTAEGGLAESVEDNETGLIVPAQSPSALAAATMRLLNEPDWAESLGQRGRRVALEERSWTSIARRVLDDLAL